MHNNIEPRSFVVEIMEYGKSVRKYSDTDYDRFMVSAKKMIDDHLSYSSKQSGNNGQKEVKNLTINVFTY